MCKLILLIFKKVELVKWAGADFRFHFWENTNSNCQNKSKDNQGGFVLVFMTVFLVVALLLTLTFSSSLILLQNKMKTVHQCRVETLEIQRQVQPLLEKLLSLNPGARALRIQRNLTEAQMVVAAATLNVHVLIALQARRRMIIAQQRILDRTQQSLITQANFILNTKTLQAHYRLEKHLLELALTQNQWAEVHNRMLPPKIPKLAVRPTDRRMAPTYEPRKDFEKYQAAGLFWIQHYKPRGFLKSSGFSKPQVKNQCLATLEESTWIPKIRKDKRY